MSQKPTNLTITLAVISSALQTISASSRNNRIEAQQILLLISLMARGEIPQADLEKLTGVGPNAVSRNVGLLGAGSPGKPGLGYVESYEDPMWRRRKLVRLTPAGKALAEKIAAATARFYR